MFVPSSKITIGDISFSGVHELEIRKSLLSYVQTAEIKLPGRMRLLSRSNPVYKRTLDTYREFKEGDEVTISLAYDGRWHEEFKGFVRRVDQSLPVVLELEGYSYKLRQKFINGKFWKSTTVKEIVDFALKDTGIKAIVDVDIPVENFPISNATVADVLDSVIKDIGLNVITAFFIEPDTIWIGMRFTKYNNTVKYRLGRNVIKDDKLVKRIVDNNQTNVQLLYTDNSGKRTRNPKKTVGTKVLKSRFVKQPDAQQLIAEAKELEINYEGLDGEFTTFLEPYIVPGDKADITDNLYGRDAGVISESIKTNYGVNGARRTIGVGIKVS